MPPSSGSVREMAGAADHWNEMYVNLHGLAQNWFRRQPAGHTLQPTAIIHEAFIRLAKSGQPVVSDRAHFFALASRVMRQVLVDHARTRNAAKRGAAWNRVTFDQEKAWTEHDSIDIIDLDDSLEKLHQLDQRQAQIVELRVIAGMSVAETAKILNVSVRTVDLDWRMARSWLQRRLGPGGAL